MDDLEAVLRENCREDINNYIFEQFKKDKPQLYATVLRTLHEINLQRLKTDYLILLKPNITSARFQVGKRKNFIFCGNFIRENEKVILLERIETIGTHFVSDNNLVNKLKDYKIGTRIGIEKQENGKFHLILPYEVNEGLFEQE